MIIIEFASTLMAITQMLAMLTSGMEGFDKVKTNFLWFFDNILMINEER
jgi:hypothetical protein